MIRNPKNFQNQKRKNEEKNVNDSQKKANFFDKIQKV